MQRRVVCCSVMGGLSRAELIVLLKDQAPSYSRFRILELLPLILSAEQWGVGTSMVRLVVHTMC